MGKSAIINFKAETQIEGIKIEVNNCNGGTLEVLNSSTQPFVLGGVEIAPNDYVALDVKSKQTDGYYTLIEISSNFSNYIPLVDEQIKVNGQSGSKQVTYTYIKTKKLCD